MSLLIEQKLFNGPVQ